MSNQGETLDFLKMFDGSRKGRRLCAGALASRRHSETINAQPLQKTVRH